MLDRVGTQRNAVLRPDANLDRNAGVANRAFAIMPDACVNIVMNRRKPVWSHLNREELECLGVVLDQHTGEYPCPVAAIRLITLTGPRII